MKDKMAFLGLLQDLTNIEGVLSANDVTEADFEDMKHIILHQMHHEYLRSYIMNQEPADWHWNCDMLRVQIGEIAREQVRKFLGLSDDQKALYPSAFTLMRSIEVFRIGDWEKAGQIASEIMRVWSVEHRIDTMSDEFRKKWLNEILRICQLFVNN